MTQEEITIALDDAEHNAELDCDVNELRPVLKQAVILIESLTADRDAWKAKAERAESSRDNWKADYYDAIEKLEAMEERAVKSAYWQERAEKAEAELKEAVEDINSLRGNPAPCLICEFDDLIGCCHKNHCNENNEYFKWRGAREGTKWLKKN